MSTLLLQLAAPLQAWGTHDRFVVRGTDHEPSFSGVVGLLMAAFGWSEADPINPELTSLAMGVRVDRPGELLSDYHTVRGGKDGDGGAKDVVVSHRHYLQDAAFLVGLEGGYPFLRSVVAALEEPSFCLYLGRKSCPPSLPLTLPDGLRAGTLESELRGYRWLRIGSAEPPSQLRLQLPAEDSDATLVRFDYPLSFREGYRAYAPRCVRELMIPVPEGG